LLRIWAISDLHLGFSTGKWMDRFGEHWRDHHIRIESAWRERVAPSDIVLLPGDFSWALKPQEVAQEFAWLAALPGRKVLIKGNHDYWWPGSRKKLEELLPHDVFALKKTSLVVDGVPIVGVRGGDFLPRVGAEDFDASTVCPRIDEALVRERRELLMSIDHLRSTYAGPRRPIALFHYPPYRVGGTESAFTRIIEAAGCSHCLFGHLHTAAEHARVFQGARNGIEYRLVSCDAIGFEPLLIDTVAETAA